MRTNRYTGFLFIFILTILLSPSCSEQKKGLEIQVYPDSVMNDVTNHPVGINVDFFMDDDNYLKPDIRTVDALRNMGVKYLRYPGGNKSDMYLFSVPPYVKSIPHLARTGTDVGYEKVIRDKKDFRNDVLDFDEFIEMCRQAQCEPVIVVAGHH